MHIVRGRVVLMLLINVCQRNSVAVEFYSKIGKVRFLSHPLGDLDVTYALHL